MSSTQVHPYPADLYTLTRHGLKKGILDDRALLTEHRSARGTFMGPFRSIRIAFSPGAVLPTPAFLSDAMQDGIDDRYVRSPEGVWVSLWLERLPHSDPPLALPDGDPGFDTQPTPDFLGFRLLLPQNTTFVFAAQAPNDWSLALLWDGRRLDHKLALRSERFLALAATPDA